MFIRKLMEFFKRTVSVFSSDAQYTTALLKALPVNYELDINVYNLKN